MECMEQIILALGDSKNLQKHLDQIPGVSGTVTGYSGGSLENPTYEDVISNMTGHALTVLVEYDSDVLSTKDLILDFFKLYDQESADQKNTGEGSYDRSAIFYVTDEQKQVIEEVIQDLQGRKSVSIVAEISQAGPFYKAEL